MSPGVAVVATASPVLLLFRLPLPPPPLPSPPLPSPPLPSPPPLACRTKNPHARTVNFVADGRHRRCRRESHKRRKTITACKMVASSLTKSTTFTLPSLPSHLLSSSSPCFRSTLHLLPPLPLPHPLGKKEGFGVGWVSRWAGRRIAGKGGFQTK